MKMHLRNRITGSAVAALLVVFAGGKASKQRQTGPAILNDALAYLDRKGFWLHLLSSY